MPNYTPNTQHLSHATCNTSKTKTHKKRITVQNVGNKIRTSILLHTIFLLANKREIAEQIV